MPTTDYFISFNGHLIEKTKPAGWPSVMQERMLFRANNEQELRDFINARAQAIKIEQGLGASPIEGLDLKDELESDPGFPKVMFVPMALIEYMTYTVRRVTGKTPGNSDPEVKPS